MDNLSVIETNSLHILKELYECNKPLNIETTIIIGHFIKRFRKIPEWTELVKFYGLKNNWKQTGAFVMVNEHDNDILFNTLEPTPYESLHQILELLNYNKPFEFKFRDKFQFIVMDVISEKSLEITGEAGFMNFYFKIRDGLKIEAPKGFYFDSLNHSHEDQMKLAYSHKYLSNCIAQNPSTGLFDESSGELVASTIQHETGSFGGLYVNDKYRRKGYGTLVTLLQGSKMGGDVTTHVENGNKASIEFMTNNGFTLIFNSKLIATRPRTCEKYIVNNFEIRK